MCSDWKIVRGWGLCFSPDSSQPCVSDLVRRGGGGAAHDFLAGFNPTPLFLSIYERVWPDSPCPESKRSLSSALISSQPQPPRSNTRPRRRTASPARRQAGTTSSSGSLREAPTPSYSFWRSRCCWDVSATAHIRPDC